MSSIDCYVPRVVSSSNWGRSANARPLSTSGVFSCFIIAPDSEANGVELRPGGISDFSNRIIVTKDMPYFGAIEAKGLEVHPLVECPADDANNQYSHLMKLLMYKVAPPAFQSSGKRSPSRYWFSFGSATKLNSGTIIGPLIPGFGRRHASFGVGLIEGAAMDVTVLYEGGRVTDQHVNDATRITERWPKADNAHVDIWPNGGAAAIDWVTLNEQANIVATEDYAWQYEGNFDFFRVQVTHNAGTWAWSHLSAVMED